VSSNLTLNLNGSVSWKKLELFMRYKHRRYKEVGLLYNEVFPIWKTSVNFAYIY